MFENQTTTAPAALFVLASLWRIFKNSSTFATMRPEQNGRHFADGFLKRIFLKEKFYDLIWISLKFVSKGIIDSKSTFDWVMAWCLTGNKPLHKLVLTIAWCHMAWSGTRPTKEISIKFQIWFLKNICLYLLLHLSNLKEILPIPRQQSCLEMGKVPLWLDQFSLNCSKDKFNLIPNSMESSSVGLASGHGDLKLVFLWQLYQHSLCVDLGEKFSKIDLRLELVFLRQDAIHVKSRKNMPGT